MIVEEPGATKTESGGAKRPAKKIKT